MVVSEGAGVVEPPSTLTMAYVLERGANLRSSVSLNGKPLAKLERSKIKLKNKGCIVPCVQ